MPETSAPLPDRPPSAAGENGAQPKRPRIFHGWWIVAVAVIVGAFNSGSSVWATSLMVIPMTTELGWSRSAYFGAQTFRALAAGVIAPIVGPWQDARRGPRLLLIATVVSMGVGLGALKFVDSLPVFYLLFGLLGAISVLGGNDMLVTAVVPKWFVRYRVRALTVASLGSSMGPMLFPLWVTAVMQAYGWRDAWLAMGLSAFLVLLPLCFLVRRQPEDMGLLPDGADRPPDWAPGRPTAGAERSLTRRQAMHEPSFWLLCLSGAAFAAAVNAFHSSWLVYFQDIGFSPAEAALSSSAFGIGSFSSRFVWGFFVRKLEIRKLMALQTSMAAVTVLLFFAIHSIPVMLLIALAHGLCFGGQVILRPFIVAEYFGRAHLGAVNGIMRPFNTAAQAVGPLVVAGLFDATGDWGLPFAAVFGTWLLSALFVAFAQPPAQVRAPDPVRSG